jgi:hypothetical protein
VSDADFYLNAHPNIKAARSSSPTTQDDKAQAVLGCERAYGPANIEYSPDIYNRGILATSCLHRRSDQSQDFGKSAFRLRADEPSLKPQSHVAGYAVRMLDQSGRASAVLLS